MYRTITILGVSFLAIACEQEEKEEVNVSPEVTSIEIVPAADVTTSTSLLCLVTGTDANQEAVSLSISWTKADGTELGTSVELALSPDIVAPEDEITCTATIADSAENASQSASVTVINTAPVISSVSISPDIARLDSTLSCSAQATDADLDDLSISYAWTFGGTEMGTTGTLDLNTLELSVADELVCTATVTDEFGGSISDTASIVVENSLPTIESVEVTPDPATGLDDLSCAAVNVADIDGDSVDLSYSWSVNGAVLVDQNTENLSSTLFTAGDSVSCAVVPNDGTVDGAAVSDSIVIDNLAPTIGFMSITPDSDVKANTLLVCIASATDPDGHDLTTSYEWTNGSGSVLGSSSSLQLSPSTVAVSDEVFCTVEFEDTSGGITSQVSSVVVENTSPVISVPASISALQPTTGTSLLCSVTIEDVNDGTLSGTNLTYEWTKDDGTILGATSTYVIDAAQTDPGDVLTCTVVGTDNNGESVTTADSVTVENSLPTSPSISLDQTTAYLYQSDLNCSIDVPSTDVDQQSILYTFEWTDPNGSVVQSTSSTTLTSTGLSSAYIGVYGVWTCTVTANDGLEDGIPSTATIMIDYQVNTLSPGDLAITEIMNNPDAVNDSDGEWFEIHNTTSELINLQGLMISDLSSTVQVDQLVIVDAGGYAVLGNNADSTTNGNVTIDFDYGSLTLNNETEELSISNESGALDIVSWTSGGAMPSTSGISMNLSSDYLTATDNDDAQYWCQSIAAMSNGDYGTPGAANDNCDEDADGTLAANDCDDTDETSETTATDGDCDGVLTADDCDDTDSTSTTVATDADCDGVLTADDCDDTDNTSTAISDDADCDGILTADDCDDTDNTSTALSDDADCDGVLTADDCDDNDATSTAVADDADCDGVLTADDCDDTDSTSTTVATDADCDGVLTADDCDDTDSTDALSSGDCDEDGVLTADDCDDTDNTSTTVATDADCDGVLTAADCDDNDATSTAVADDADCDGVLTADDCDDTDSTSTTVATDADCDGVLTADDCDDTDSTDALLSGDCDEDGVLTADDCDDTDNTSTTVATDADCDGVLTAADCDDNDNSVPTADDQDCDGVTVSAGDCNDNDASVYPFAGDTYDDGVDSDCDNLDCEAASDGSTYFAVCPDAQSYGDWYDGCLDAGYDGLASIQSATENDFVYGLLSSAGLDSSESPWIGYSDGFSEGNWSWVDSSTAGYTNWAANEPNGGAAENCAQVNFPFGTGEWNDTFCSDTIGAVCQVR